MSAILDASRCSYASSHSRSSALTVRAASPDGLVVTHVSKHSETAATKGTRAKRDIAHKVSARAWRPQPVRCVGDDATFHPLPEVSRSGYARNGILFKKEMAKLNAGDPFRSPVFQQVV